MIEDMTLSGGNGFGATLNASGGGVNLESVVVKDNAGNNSSGAIAYLGGQNHPITTSTVSNNSGFSNCAAIYAETASFTATNVTVSGNSTTASGGAGAICAVNSSSATFRSTMISSNTSN